MSKEELPKGFTCKKCGKEEVFPPYVYAHWNEPLTHSCPCGRVHKILRGKATVSKGR
jgi:transcription elongation factor Elf1